MRSTIPFSLVQQKRDRSVLVSHNRPAFCQWLLTTLLDYEGPAAELLHRFMHFSAQSLPHLLPVVQQRVSNRNNVSQDSHSQTYQIYQEIQQEAGRMYLQRMLDAESRMPQLGLRSDELDEGVVEDSVGLQRGAANLRRSAFSSPPRLSEDSEALGQVLPASHSDAVSGSMVTSLDDSSPGASQTPPTSQDSLGMAYDFQPRAELSVGARKPDPHGGSEAMFAHQDRGQFMEEIFDLSTFNDDRQFGENYLGPDYSSVNWQAELDALDATHSSLDLQNYENFE